MFHGRKNELRILKDNYEAPGFKMIVLYGRRRVGKSFLLQRFFQTVSTKIIAFQAIENSKELSIESFRDALLDVYPSNYEIELKTWKACFAYLNDHLGEEKVILCIDEINYIFREDDALASLLQDEIDNHLMSKNVLLVVCGSNVSSIENEILAASSPLYGRRSLSMKLQEFDYVEASEFYPAFTPEERIIAYAVFGGKGKYLAAIDPSLSIKDNIIKHILTPGGTLADEIDLLLKDDFRDPAYYKELLYILSMGNTAFNDIQAKMGGESSKVATYLSKLIDARIVEKKEIAGGKKKNDFRYFIQDNFLSFYFRFVYKRKHILNILATPESYYERFIQNDLSAFVGLKFEDICAQYIALQSLRGQLPFLPLQYGKYYGKHRDGSTFDIDVFFRDEDTVLCGECKFTNRSFCSADLNELMSNASEVPAKKYLYYAFVKSGVDDIVRDHCPDLRVVALDDLYAKR